MGLTILIVSFLIILLTLWMFGGIREMVGDLVNKMFPREHLASGDEVKIFLNGEYNRSATITSVSADKLYIYNGSLGLPIDYRGRFYAIGVDMSDGSRLVYIRCRRHFRFVKAAEIIRAAFNIIDDENMLPFNEENKEAQEYDKSDVKEEAEYEV